MSLLGKLFRPGCAGPVGPPQPADKVRAAVLGVNRATAPFQVRPGETADESDLVAEWRIVDAGWYEIFAKAHLEKTFKVLMRLDEAAHEVRSVDQEWSVEWRAGVPQLSLAASVFRGQQTSIEFGKAYGFTEQLSVGEIYNYRFATKELKEPLQNAVAACGWRWRAGGVRQDCSHSSRRKRRANAPNQGRSMRIKQPEGIVPQQQRATSEAGHPDGGSAAQGAHGAPAENPRNG